MSNISNKKINQALAEFMGQRDPYIFRRNDMRRCIYTESMDLLLTVVVKLNASFGLKLSDWPTEWEALVETEGKKYFSKPNKSPARALAMAIYQVLKERE